MNYIVTVSSLLNTTQNIAQNLHDPNVLLYKYLMTSICFIVIENPQFLIKPLLLQISCCTQRQKHSLKIIIN